MLSVLVDCIFFFFYKRDSDVQQCSVTCWGGPANRCRVDSSSAQLAPELHLLPCTAPPTVCSIGPCQRRTRRQPQLQSWASDDSVFLHVCLRETVLALWALILVITNKCYPVSEWANMESMDNEDQLYDGWNSGTWANRIIWASTVFFVFGCAGFLLWLTVSSLMHPGFL